MRRPTLVDRLIDARDAALAVIVAPPGYGKSSLLCEWAQRDERPFLWAPLHDDPELTAESILDAFDRAAWVGPSPVCKLKRLAAEGTDQILPPLMRLAGRQERSFVLVFEDAHLVAPASLRKVVRATLKDLPDGSTLAVASRTEPPLPIGRMRAHRKLVEIRMRDLAMAPAEAATLLANAGLELEFEEVRDLVAETEGWPAALYLAALSMRDGLGIGYGKARFRGDDHLLAEYLRDDVLSAVPPDLTDFLLRTSVLDELSGPVCDDLLQQHGSALALSRLADVSQLLVPLDAAHETFRWQGLFGAALRAQFRRSEPKAELALQARASDWYAQRGDTDRAIKHSVAAGRAERAGDLLFANIVTYLAYGRNEMVQGWLNGFSPERIAASPSLALCAAHSALDGGDAPLAQRWALTAAAVLEQDPEVARPASLATGLTVIDIAVARKGARNMRTAAVQSHQLEPDDSPWRPVLCLLRGVSEHLSGDRDAARRALQEGVDLGGAIAPVTAAQCLAVDAMIAIERREWGIAEDLTDRARTMIDEFGLSRHRLSALTFAASAAARAHEGRSDESKGDLRTALDLLTALRDYVPWYGAQARILLAHASLWLADIVRARTLLAEASRLARRIPDAVIFEQWFDEAWAYMDTLAEASLSGPSALTIAELRILRFLPSHRSFREIALQLGVSANTVKTQAHSVYRKLGAASRSEAVARASEAGLLGQ